MREFYRLIRFEFHSIARWSVYWLFVLVGFILVPLKFSRLLDTWDLRNFIILFHIQIIHVLLFFPVFLSRTFNEETEVFVPPLILAKIRHKWLYITAKSMVIWLLGWLTVTAIDTVLMGVYTFRTGSGNWVLLGKTALAGLTTLLFYSQVLMAVTLLINRVIYVLFVMIVYVLVGIKLDHPYFSIWFGPMSALKYLTEHSSEFWLSRALLSLLALGMAVMLGRWHVRGWRA